MEEITSTEILDDVDSIKYDDALMSILETDLVFTHKEIDSDIISEAGIFGYIKWPKYEVTFPRTAQVGVPFDVVFDYAFVIPDEETGSYVNFNDQCSENNCGHNRFSAKVSSFVDVKSDKLEYFSKTFDQKMIPMRNYTHYQYHPEFNNTKALQETFTFVINEPSDVYRIGEIHVQIQLHHNDDLVYFYVDKKGTVIFDQMMTQDTFDQSLFARSTAPSVMSVVSAIETEMDKLQKRSYDWTRAVIPAPVGLRDGVPPELYGYYADKLLRNHPGENYEELLRSYNYTQTWIDDFLSAMPELKTQAIDFLTSYTLLPLAYGAEATTTIFGKLVNTDEDNSSVFVHGGTVCAYDADTNSLNQIILNNEHICTETTNSGTFVFDVPTADPNGSGNTDLVLKAFAKNSHFEFFLNNNEDIVKIDDNESPREISVDSYNVGFFDISEELYRNVPIEHQHFWALDRLTDIQDWYTDNVVASTEKIFVIYDPTLCSSGANYDPDRSKMFLTHTEDEDGVNCDTDNIHSPLTNEDTLAHEFGHAVFYQTYDSYDSAAT